MEIIIKKNPNDNSFPAILIERKDFDEIIINGPKKPKIPSFGFPVNRVYLRKIYEWLIDNKYIEPLPWDYFRYFFDGRMECPDDITPIVWLKRSKEGIGILVNNVFKPFIGNIYGTEQRKRLSRLTSEIFIDKNKKSCHMYNKSSQFSRFDAMELEVFLEKIKPFAKN